MKRSILSIMVLCVITTIVSAKPIETYQFNQVEPSHGPIGNGITDLVGGGSNIWIGTGHGLSRYINASQSFENFVDIDGLADGSISALWASGDSIWIAAASDSFVASAEESLPFGTGFSFSSDNGATWAHFDQPGPTPIQNLCYDVTVVDGVVWGASFGGGLLKSVDGGQTWEQLGPDTLIFDPNAYLNHRAFSVLNADGDLWVGTAGGINRSEDNGLTWSNYNSGSQQNPISGNFVVALAHQQHADKNIIWAASWKAEGQDEEYGISKTENDGLTWTVHLEGVKAQNIYADGPNVYVATHEGLYKSPDYGESWFLFPPLVDNQSDEKVYAVEFYSVYAQDGMIWTGTADGLARSSNNGHSWNIFRAFRQTGQNEEPRTYAYPNPFSSKRHNQLGDEGVARLQYNVTADASITVKIYDFAMDLVTTVANDKFRSGPGDYNEVWSGKNDYDDEVANGVYFYSVQIDGDGTYWGKVLVVN
jgi:hypothetical protein